MEIGITVDILRGIFLGGLNESLLGEHALHGGVWCGGNRIVNDRDVLKWWSEWREGVGEWTGVDVVSVIDCCNGCCVDDYGVLLSLY